MSGSPSGSRNWWKRLRRYSVELSHRISEQTDPFDLDLDNITGLHENLRVPHEAHASRRAGGDHVAHLSLVVDLTAHWRNDNRLVRPDEGVRIHAEQERLLRSLRLDLFDVVLVIQTNPDEFLRVSDGRTEDDFGCVEEIALNAAGRALQPAELVFEKLKSILHRQNFFNRKHDSRKFQEVVPDRLGNVKARVAESAPQPDQGWGIFPRKIHEFHAVLLRIGLKVNTGVKI